MRQKCRVEGNAKGSGYTDRVRLMACPGSTFTT